MGLMCDLAFRLDMLCPIQVLAASLEQTTKPRFQGTLWLYLDSDIEELQGSLLAIQVALAGGAGHMATALMLSLKLPLLADILSSHYSGVTRESIEISVSAGSAILEVRTTPSTACCLTRLQRVAFATRGLRLRGKHHIRAKPASTRLIPTTYASELIAPVPHLPRD
jgi:hypothetical protein